MVPVLPGEVCQRWRERRTSYRPAGEPIDPARYSVALLDRDRDARDFVVRHHYAASYPAARLRVGLFRDRGAVWSPELVGVCVFGVPMSQAVMPKWLGADVEGVELSRLVLLDEVPANGETWFLARAFRLLRSALPEVRGVLSFSDPVERTTADGAVVKPGHIGVIYKAMGGRYLGRANASTLLLDPAGRVVSARAVSKVRTEDQGRAYAERALLDAGAPPRRTGEDPGEWVTRCLREAPWRRLRHPGNHAYVWPLDRTLALRPALAPPCSWCGQPHGKPSAAPEALAG